MGEECFLFQVRMKVLSFVSVLYTTILDTLYQRWFFDFKVASKGSFHFTNLLLHSNKVTNKLDLDKTAAFLISIYNGFDQVEISDHHNLLM